MDVARRTVRSRRWRAACLRIEALWSPPERAHQVVVGSARIGYTDRVSHTQLTDEPCPKCGASLDIKVSISVAPPRPAKDDSERETVRLKRTKTCPDCGWSIEL